MLQLTVNDSSTYEVAIEDGKIDINGKVAVLDVSPQPNGLISVLHNGKSYTAIIESVDRKAKELVMRLNGQLYKTSIKEPIDLLLSNMGLDLKAMHKAEPIKAPMPGMVLKILVTPGQKINQGDG